jgi:hypothetical protein
MACVLHYRSGGVDKPACFRFFGLFRETSRLVSRNKPACFRNKPACFRKQAGLFRETSRLVSGNKPACFRKQAGLFQETQETSRLVSGNKPACFRFRTETGRLDSASELKQAGLFRNRPACLVSQLQCSENRI